jgi:hypothetical protein
LKRLCYISFFVSSFLIGFTFVFLALNGFNESAIANLQHPQIFGDEETEQNIETINHQTGFDEQHTACFNRFKENIAFKRIRGRRDENRFYVFFLDNNLNSFLYSEGVSFPHEEVFITSFLSNCFQLRGPPVSIS